MRLADEAYCRTLVDAGVDEYFVSVTAGDAATHDAITDVPGSFEKTLRGLRNLEEFDGVVTLTNTVITRRSFRHLPRIVDLLGDLRRLVQMDFWGYWPMSEVDEKDLIVSHVEALPFLREAIARARAGPCRGGEELPRVPARRGSRCAEQRSAEAAHRPGVLARVHAQRLRAVRPPRVLRLAAMPRAEHGVHQEVRLARRRPGPLAPGTASRRPPRRRGRPEPPGTPGWLPRRRTPSPTLPAPAGSGTSSAGLNVPFGYERSFRLCRGAILPDRFLLSLGKGSLGAGPDATILDLCRRLDLPERSLQAVAQALPAAWFVHFGFEQGRTACLYKVYLETGLPAGRPSGARPGPPASGGQVGSFGSLAVCADPLSLVSRARHPRPARTAGADLRRSRPGWMPSRSRGTSLCSPRNGSARRACATSKSSRKGTPGGRSTSTSIPPGSPWGTCPPNFRGSSQHFAIPAGPCRISVRSGYGRRPWGTWRGASTARERTSSPCIMGCEECGARSGRMP